MTTTITEPAVDPVTPADVAAQKDEHHPFPRSRRYVDEDGEQVDVCSQCVDEDDVPVLWPCEPYRFASEVERLLAILAAVATIAHDPDTVSALEHGVIDGGANGPTGVDVHEAAGYGADALRDIRAAIGPGYPVIVPEESEEAIG